MAVLEYFLFYRSSSPHVQDEVVGSDHIYVIKFFSCIIMTLRMFCHIEISLDMNV